MADETGTAAAAAAPPPVSADDAPPPCAPQAPPPENDDNEEPNEPLVEVAVKWSGAEYSVKARPTDTVAHLKRELQRATAVDAKRLKLLGLKRRAPGSSSAAAAAASASAAVTDDTPVGELALKPGQRLMMMGQRDDAIAALEAETAAAAASAQAWEEDDENEDANGNGDDDLPLAQRPEIKEKLERRIASATIDVLHPPRADNPKIKCLVLDIDYTLFDLGSSAERPEQLARPYLHEFLERSYRHYDLVIWSATSVKWVEVKMRELGVLGNHGRYKLTALMDCRSMLTVRDAKRGVYDCKPLQVLWARFPGVYRPDNTVMLDDLRRNFVLNPQNGLVIRPFRHCHTRGRGDRELVGLADYLELAGARETLADLDHRKWERYVAKRAERLARLQAEWRREAEEQGGEEGGAAAGGSGGAAAGAGGGEGGAGGAGGGGEGA